MRARSSSSQDTARVAECLARAVAASSTARGVSASGAVVYLTGALGAGKSVFARAFIYEWLRVQGLAAPQSVPSPSFSIVNEYGGGACGRLVHADLYRIESSDELLNIGFSEYLNESSVCLVEWPEKAPAESGLLSRDATNSAHIKILSAVDVGSGGDALRELQMDLPLQWQAHLKNEISELLF